MLLLRLFRGRLSFRGPRLVRRQSVKRLESMLVNLFANFDTDAPNNSIAVFANVQISALVNSLAPVEFVIFAAALEIISILPTLT